MALKCVLLLLITITCLMANATATRELPTQAAGFNLTVRLDTNMLDCWNALTELKTCSNEIILFFINGQLTNIGAACCQSIRMITNNCWATMLTSIGFTPQECDILRGYCDASSAPAASPSVQPLHMADSVVMVYGNV